MTACRWSCSLRLKALRQWHRYGRSGLCDCLWRVKWSFRFKAALQISHTNLRKMKIHKDVENFGEKFPYRLSRFWWTIICASRISFSGYATWHSGQTNSMDPSSANFNRISPAFGFGFFSLGAFFFFFFFVGPPVDTCWPPCCCKFCVGICCWIGWIMLAIDDDDGIKLRDECWAWGVEIFLFNNLTKLILFYRNNALLFDISWIFEKVMKGWQMTEIIGDWGGLKNSFRVGCHHALLFQQ